MPTRKLTEDQVRYIRLSAERAKEMAIKFGVAARTIHEIRNRETYRDIPDEEPQPNR